MVSGQWSEQQRRIPNLYGLAIVGQAVLPVVPIPPQPGVTHLGQGSVISETAGGLKRRSFPKRGSPPAQYEPASGRRQTGDAFVLVCLRNAAPDSIRIPPGMRALAPGSYADTWFGLYESLGELLGRPVGLMETSVIKNPYFRQSIDRGQVLLYAA